MTRQITKREMKKTGLGIGGCWNRKESSLVKAKLRRMRKPLKLREREVEQSEFAGDSVEVLSYLTGFK